MTEYVITWLHGFRFELGSFLFILRPLIAIVIMGICVYFIVRVPKS
jgi:hypothetical protein